MSETTSSTVITTNSNSSTYTTNTAVINYKDYCHTYISPVINTVNTTTTSDFNKLYVGNAGDYSWAFMGSTDAPTNFKYFSSHMVTKVLSHFTDKAKSYKILDISKLISKNWVVPKDEIDEQISFESPLQARKFFEVSDDIQFQPENLILNDEELTFNYYMSIINNFLDNYVILECYPSTKIRDFHLKALDLVPQEYGDLNLLAYSRLGESGRFAGIYYICEYKDLGRVKKMLQEEVEKAEELIGDNNPIKDGVLYWSENKLNSVNY